MQKQGHEDCSSGTRCETLHQISTLICLWKLNSRGWFLLYVSEYQTGVTSVAIEGADRSLVVVIGDGVDSVSLTRSLRKKLGSATIQSLQELKAESAEKKTDPTPTFYYSQYPQYPLYHANTVAYPDQYPLYYADAVVSDQYSSNCAIMWQTYLPNNYIATFSMICKHCLCFAHALACFFMSPTCFCWADKIIIV